MITIMDLCEIGKITIGSIDGGPAEKKITALSHCVGDYNNNKIVKINFVFSWEV